MENYEELRSVLELEKIEENLFRGQNYRAPWGRVFGGQVVAQALYAALQTVDVNRHLHSMHAYFLLVGDIDQPIVYDVDRIRDGGSFTTRRVTAIQKGRPIFTLSCSFNVNSHGFSHDAPMPDVPDPETLPSDVELAASLEDMPDAYQRFIGTARPIECRLPGGVDQLLCKDKSATQSIWIKAKGELPDDARFHQVALAYASDYHLLATALIPHRAEVDFSTLFIASLDHSLWFHRPLRLDEWLLYVMDSPHASNERGFTRGSIYNRAGQMVASAAQEGLLRTVQQGAARSPYDPSGKSA